MAATAGTKIGSGYVTVEPDFSGFQSKVEKSVKERFSKLGDQAGRTLTDSVSKRVRRGGGDLGTAAALAPITKRFQKAGSDAGAAFARGLRKRRGRSAGAAIGDELGLDAMTAFFDQAKKGAPKLSIVERATRKLRPHLRGLGGELRELGSSIRVTSSGFGGFDGVMARTNRSAQFFRNILRTIKWPVFIAGIGLAAQGLSALAAGAVATVSALGPLSGLLVTLPAAALVAAQAFSVLKLATAGVGDAVKAALDAEVKGGTQAVDTMRQQEAAAERVADAKRNLASVQRQAKFAQEDLTDARDAARRSLEDMRGEAERSHDSEQNATLQLKQAQKELAKTLADPDASGLDVRFAEEAVDQARHDLKQTRLDAQRAREDYSKAHKAGIEKMPEVVSAKRAEEDATRAVADANRDLERAVRDSTDAMAEQGSAASALEEKMSQLPAPAQKFVRMLVALKPRLDALRDTAAGGFFPGAEKGLRGVLRNFGVFRGIVDGTSKALGRVASKAGRKLGSEVWGKDLGRLGKLNERVLGRLGDAGMGFADALREVMVAAEPFLDWLSESTEEFGKWMSTEAQAGRRSGVLAEFFDRTRETMERVWPILKGVGGALLNIGEAARPLGNEILDALGGAAEGWREWTGSIGGQNKLKRYFAESKPAIFEMGRLIRDAGKVFFELGKQRGVADLLRLVRTELIPAMRDLVGATTGWASRFLEDFGQLRRDGVPAFDAFIQVLAEHAAEAGWRIAKGLWAAFWNASPLGKAAIGLWLLKFGFIRSLGAKVGGRLATSLGQRFLAVVAPYFAAEGLFGDVIAGRMKRLKGTFGKWGGKLGLTFALAFATWGLSDRGTQEALVSFGKKMGQWVSDGLAAALNFAFDKINDSMDKLNVLGKFGVDAPEIPKVSLDWMSDFRPAYQNLWPEPDEIPAPKTDKAERGYERFRKRVGREGDLTRHAFKAPVSLIPGIAERSAKGALTKMLPRLDALVTGGSRKSEDFKNKVGGQFTGLANISIRAMQSIGISVSNLLDALNLKKPKGFNVQKALQEMPKLPPIQERQEGGFIVPGFGSGDKFKTMLPPNSFILNREATKSTYFQKGGMTPVALEPGERVFMPPEVTKLGAGNLAELNRAVPRFQKGGRLGPEPQISGPVGPLRRIGQAAVKNVYEGAKDFLDRQKPMGAGGGPLGSAPGALGALEKLASSFGLGVTSGYRPGDDGYHGINRARDFGGPADKMLAFAAAAARRFGRRMLELIHTPLGWGIKDGRRVGLGFWGPEVNADHFDHVHGAMQRGGLLERYRQKFAIGGGVNLNKTFPGAMYPSSAWSALPEMSFPIAAALAEAAGKWAGTNMPGVTMAQVSKGEGALKPGSMGDDDGDGSPDGYGWLAITRPFGDSYGVGGLGGYQGMLNPVANAAVAAKMYGAQGLSAWYGQRFVTSTNAHYTGDYDIRNSLGGKTFGAAVGNPKPGESSANGGGGKENVPATYKGAKTGALSFGPIPKDLKGIDKELRRWEREVGIYRKAKAHASKNDKPEIAQAIGANIEKIEARMKGLRDARYSVRLREVKSKLTRKFKRAFERFGSYEKIIAGSQRAYEISSQYAEQVVGLEPQSPEITPQAEGESDAAYAKRSEDAEKAYVETFSRYVDGPERNAFGTVLERVADWRNNILRAERFGFGKGEYGFGADVPSVLASSNAWEKVVRGARRKIEQINIFSDNVGERVTDWRKDNPGKPLPDGLRNQLEERERRRKALPELRLKDSQFTEAVKRARELFFAGGENRIKPPPIPLAGTGSLEDALTEVQGIHVFPKLHELLSAGHLAPPRVPGQFGGIIWELQGTIEELGLKIRQAANGIGGGGGGTETDDDSELTELERTLRIQAEQRGAVSERQRNTIAEFFEDYPFPRFHSGGVFPGPKSNEGLALLRGEERIRTPEQELEMAEAIRGLGGTAVPQEVNVSVVLYEDQDRAVVKVNEQEINALVERKIRSASTSRQLGSTNLR